MDPTRTPDRRPRCRWPALWLLPLAALASACKKDEPAGAGATTSATAPAAAPSGPLQVAFVYVGPVGDAGWTYAHDRGRKAAVDKYGAAMATRFVENVPESADAERVFRDLVEQGNQLIFGTTFGYMEAMLEVAREFEGVRFEHATGYKTSKNLRTYARARTRVPTSQAWSLGRSRRATCSASSRRSRSPR